MHVEDFIRKREGIIKAHKRGILLANEAVRCLCTLFVETQTTQGIDNDIDLALKLLKEG